MIIDKDGYDNAASRPDCRARRCTRHYRRSCPSRVRVWHVERDRDRECGRVHCCRDNHRV